MLSLADIGLWPSKYGFHTDARLTISAFKKKVNVVTSAVAATTIIATTNAAASKNVRNVV